MTRPGRLMLVQLALMLFVLLLIARSAQVQLFQQEQWSTSAIRQQTSTATIPAPRGAIFDVDDIPLARNVEYVSLGISPREISDQPRLASVLRRLRLPARTIRQATNPELMWLAVPGLFPRESVAELRGMRGVTFYPVYQRWYSSRPSTRRLVGRATPGGSGTDGMERALDDYLTGTEGERVQVRDGARRTRGSPDFVELPPRAGDDVVLTISQEWQEIAERALREAVDSTGADGGDMVVLDPWTGSIRALAAVRLRQPVSGSPALTEPFEPGSTIKPLIAASLLSLGRVSDRDTVSVGEGSYRIHGRTITDTHTGDSVLTLAEVIVHSSNVGIAKFSERLTAAEEYETLRDFGFGTPTGVLFPSEASGFLRPVGDWTPQSAASLAIGYELSVTALQLATAYAAFANGGELLEPALVQEIRNADGDLRFRHERRVVRRVMSEKVAGTLMEMLRKTVEAGTASAAAPAGYMVAGKTGTARKVVNGSYAGGGYTASFVGIFPADRPQVVVVVKLDGPRGRYYGGQTAAPAFRAAVVAALAARGASIDRATLTSSGADAEPAMIALAELEPEVVEPIPGWVLEPESEADSQRVPDAGPVRFTIPLVVSADTASLPPRPVPDVLGLSLREAARTLHRAGFRVRIGGTGRVVSSSPDAGVVQAAGSSVRVVAEP